MTLRVIGAGVGRTGTMALKLALEQLLGAPCYHMIEVFKHPEHVPLWREAALGRPIDWRGLLQGYAAAVDWPASAFWPELMSEFPDAPVLLSSRPAEAWWTSASNTIFTGISSHGDPEWRSMIDALFSNRFTPELQDREACIAAFERHNAQVRASVPADRLLEWTAGDGWAPICSALNLPIPDAPFPHVNTTEEFRRRHAAQPQP